MRRLFRRWYFGVLCWWYRRQIIQGVRLYIRGMDTMGFTRQMKRHALRELFRARGFQLWQYFE